MLISSMGISPSHPGLICSGFSWVTQPTKALLMSAKPIPCGTITWDHIAVSLWGPMAP